jgi:hypothetical protein
MFSGGIGKLVGAKATIGLSGELIGRDLQEIAQVRAPCADAICEECAAIAWCGGDHRT